MNESVSSYDVFPEDIESIDTDDELRPAIRICASKADIDWIVPDEHTFAARDGASDLRHSEFEALKLEIESDD